MCQNGVGRYGDSQLKHVYGFLLHGGIDLERSCGLSKSMDRLFAGASTPSCVCDLSLAQADWTCVT